MKIIDNAVIKDRYECIVVGTGIGGITAAALLANKGIDTLMIEQRRLPGGACTSLKQVGQSFDIGSALLFGFGGFEGTLAPHQFIMNSLREPLNVIQHDSIYRCHFRQNGKMVQVTFWQDFDRFFEELAAAFPAQKEELRKFYEVLNDGYSTLTKMDTTAPISEQSLFAKMKMFLKHPIGALRLFRWMNKDMKSLMDKYLKEDPKIKTFFDFLLSLMLTTKVEETPLLLAIGVFIIAFHGGACYPEGSPQMLPNALERAFERLGGTTLYRHKVEEILIENKKAYGVRLDNGTEILAKYVISDATIWQNYNKLINKKHLTQKRIDWANNFKPTLSAMLMYIAVKEETFPEGFRSIEMFIEDISNYEGGIAILYIPSMEDPSICPPGTHSMTVLAELFEEFPRPGDPEYQSEAYYKLKEKETNRVLDDLEQYLPNLRKNIITMKVATPATIERFTLRDFGSIGGPKQALGQHLLNRPRAKSEFKNLFFVGDSTTMGEGVVMVTMSAVGGANMVLKSAGKKPYKTRKFDKNYIHFVEGKPRTPLPRIDEELDDKKARRVAVECQWCLEAKCTDACPAKVDALNFMRRMESNNFLGAARTIRQTNPLGEICGIICPHENFCEKDCNHKEFSDESARIGQLEAWVCKRAGESGWDKAMEVPNGKKVAVVGAGPAGLSCAYFLSRLGYNVDVFEKQKKKGGMLTHVIPASRLSPDAIERDLKGVSLPSINFKYGMELGKDIKISQLSDDYDAVFLAPGLWAGHKLDLPGIENVDITDALSFIIEYHQKGKVDVKGKLLVIGGGSVATDAVLVARESGVKDITMVCLESREEMPALKTEIAEILEWGCELHNSWGPKEFADGKLCCIECTSVFDDDGKFAPKFNIEQRNEFEFDHVIMAVGQEIETNLATYLKEEFGTAGLIEVNPETLQVNGKSKIYAGGDIIRGAGTVVQSVADGRRAAMAIDANLSKIFSAVKM
ncbi:MAG: FAD-dependent oxidoreductase [Candidatus Helarchaeota archaeon]|nr:FAD-dependent oxidoreductase [Candidatus Helarchaeota archaeon]